MGLSEALDAMHAERRKAFDMYSKLVSNVPEPGDVEKDLKKQKTEKDKKKAQDKWAAMLEKADYPRFYIDGAIDSWNDKIPAAMRARTELGKKIDSIKEALEPIEEKIKSILSSPTYDLVYGGTGLGKVIEATAADLKVQRKSLDKLIQEFDDGGDDINSQKKFVGTLSEGAATYKRKYDEANGVLVKSQPVGKKSKAGKKR